MLKEGWYAIGLIILGFALMIEPMIFGPNVEKINESQNLSISCNSSAIVPLILEKGDDVSFYFVLNHTNSTSNNHVEASILDSNNENIPIGGEIRHSFTSEWDDSFMATHDGPYKFLIDNGNCDKNFGKLLSIAWSIKSRGVSESSFFYDVGGIILAFGAGFGFDRLILYRKSRSRPL